MDLTLEYGSILALKILTGTKTRAILNNTDNKCLKNEEKTFSSSYPPRNLNSTMVHDLFYMADNS